MWKSLQNWLSAEKDSFFDKASQIRAKLKEIRRRNRPGAEKRRGVLPPFHSKNGPKALNRSAAGRFISVVCGFCTVSLLLLVVGFFTYGRLVEKVFHIDDRQTPAIAHPDGVGGATLLTRGGEMPELTLASLAVSITYFFQAPECLHLSTAMVTGLSFPDRPAVPLRKLS